MEFSFHILLCSYVNWCSSCSNVILETTVNVTTVDWSGCTDTRQNNMTVTNSDSVVLYRNSTSCCSGNLTILYNGEIKRHHCLDPKYDGNGEEYKKL
uniref:Uncharacterized protein n=1 Tax=Magallana gigas TaxID=29159 RepID=A0A8W8MY96_MAGGI